MYSKKDQMKFAKNNDLFITNITNPILQRVSSTNFTWSILEYFVPYVDWLLRIHLFYSPGSIAVKFTFIG